ncbi:MAG: L-histidine N(alpha)-methyltransferase [Acidimicrobiales bacterium]
MSATGTDLGARVRIRSLLDDGHLDAALRRDVAEGLAAPPRSLPPKWFYDAVGSDLFDQITRLPEYYPTEAERAALLAHASEIVALSGADRLAELGSGSSDKTRALLDALAAEGRLAAYLPLDVSASALEAAAHDLVAQYPGLVVDGVVGDFDHHLDAIPRGGRRLLAFLGGTIGNYDPPSRARLLTSIADALDPGECLLLGTDLVKDRGRLVAAYDDAAGVTAAFDRNVLAVVNRELGADFDLARFEHVAVWSEEHSRIEMRLRSTEAQTVAIPSLGMEVRFAAGEEVLTEISTKFTPDAVRAELWAARLEPIGWWTDSAGDFALSLARKPSTTSG